VKTKIKIYIHKPAAAAPRTGIAMIVGNIQKPTSIVILGHMAGIQRITQLPARRLSELKRSRLSPYTARRRKGSPLVGGCTIDPVAICPMVLLQRRI
jgi:hypothetical protein